MAMMRFRVLTMAVPLVLVACAKPSQTARPGNETTANGPATKARQEAAICGEPGQLELSSVKRVGRDEVSFCLDAKPRACYRVDLKTGRHALAQVTPPVVDAPAEDQANATALKACHPRTKQCKTLPRPKDYSGHIVTTDGRYILVVTRSHEVKYWNKEKQGHWEPTWFHLRLLGFDTLAEIRRLDRAVSVGDKAETVDLESLGPSVLLQAWPCAGPCASNWLVDPERLRVLASLDLVDGATPTPVSGSVYAFTDAFDKSGATHFLDVRTGRRLATVDWRVALKPYLADEGGDNLTVRTVTTASGRVGVFLSGGGKTPLDGDVVSFSLQQLKPRYLRFPACKTAPPPGARATTP
ncbi:MAG: hypothetical protein RBU30_19855 [Polyangia bacterium]|jgi:hypothetical protein|nr:hypothetical protein [Polyangia bacterium]